MRRVLFAIVCWLTIACHKSNGVNDKILFQRNITNVAGAGTVGVNQATTITVSWPFTSSCDVLEKFETTRQGNVFIIKAMGYKADGFCQMYAGIGTTAYSFVSATPGVYELRFTNVNGTVITHTVIVQ